ncbi:MAG TPA: YdeI/OmpD-associated family protein, partial [Solirubrobacteraceae bacterium]
MPEHERHPKDDLPIIAFEDDAAWEGWLEENHAGSRGVWIKTAKKKTGIPTVTHAEALDTAICFGWIDGQRHPYDDTYYLQRFTPRTRRSKWSQVNVKKAEALIGAQRMRPAGHAQIEAAKADGRWAAAYEPQSRATVPADFQAALDDNPDAKAFFATLTGVNRYSFLYRIQNAKRPETR